MTHTVVRDYCAACGELLAVHPVHGVRIACCPEPERIYGQASQMYWSPLAPHPEDLRGFRQLTGRDLKIQTEWWEKDTGYRHSHPPLFLYRGLA